MRLYINNFKMKFKKLLHGKQAFSCRVENEIVFV